MHLLSFVTFALGLGVSIYNDSPQPQVHQSQPEDDLESVEGVVHLRIRQVAHDPEVHGKMFETRDTMPKRKGKKKNQGKPISFIEHLSNERYFYLSQVKVGTPEQDVNLLLDTGSSDTWMFGPGANAEGMSTAVENTVFDHDRSKTWKPNNTNWEIQYGIGEARGIWGTDRFTIGGATLKKFSFGIATESNQINQGIIGIGRKNAQITNKQHYTYDNLPYKMKSDGLIKRAAYSLYLDDINSQKGTILFGGVDHSKYQGKLTVLPLAHSQHLGVKVDGVYTDGRVQRNLLEAPMVAVLDSGTSLTYVPGAVLGGIHEALNANPSFSIGQKYYCDCNITSNLILDFGTTRIEIPAYQFLWPIETLVSSVTSNLLFPSNSCYVGIEEAAEDFILVGDNLLRAMYVVYDLEGERIALAPFKAGGKRRIQAITNKIPGA